MSTRFDAAISSVEVALDFSTVLHHSAGLREALTLLRRLDPEKPENVERVCKASTQGGIHPMTAAAILRTIVED